MRRTTTLLFPAVLFGRPLFAAWLLDYIFAFVIGIAFQYYTIQPMRHLSVRKGIIAAIKADTLSLTAWQIGMYGWMAISVFLIFGHEPEKTGPVRTLALSICLKTTR